VFISILISWVNWTAGIPGGHAFIPSPSALWIAGWYGALIAALVTYGSLRRVVVIVAVVAFAVRICHGVRDDTVHVDILDVGRGNAALIDVPGSGDVLLDAGPRFSGRDVVRYLRKVGVSHLESLILTHGDANHVGGAFDILKSVPISELWGAPFLSSSLLYRKLLGEAAKRNIRIRRLERGDHGVLSGGVEWEALSPSGDFVCRRADEGSLVIRISRGAAAVLFMGGADGAVEPSILRWPVEPVADILVVGNHGAAGTCSESFLAATDLSSAIISVGADNTEGQPDRGVLARLADRGIAVWRTDESGSLRITFDPEAEQGVPYRVSAISLNSGR
jgi:beta-lactamase superfamily II metal-dependent hydrolase